MLHRPTLLAALLLALTFPAFADQSHINPQAVDAAARSLAAAAQAFAGTLQRNNVDLRAVQDASLLADAAQGLAEHRADYGRVQRAFEQVRGDVQALGPVSQNGDVRAQWLQVRERQQHLLDALNAPAPGPGPGPIGQPHGVSCLARNLRGQLFQGLGPNAAIAQQEAMNLCRANSAVCRIYSCQAF